jgi:hypothetical protein
MAKPILPLEWLVMPRTGSMASNVGPAVTSTFCPASTLGVKKAITSSSSSAGSSMRPSPVSPQAWSPLPTASTVAPSCATWRQVALRGRVRPHLAVHGRGQQQGHALLRARQAQQAQQFVGPALGQAGDEIGAARRDQDGIGLAREVDVRHVVGLARIPLRAVHRPVRQRLHGHGRDELGGRLGHHHLHGGALLDERAAQLRRFVTGYASAEAQDDVFAGKLFHGPQFSRQYPPFAARGRRQDGATLYNPNFPPP